MNLQTKKMKELPDEERYELQPNRAIHFWVEIKIVDDANNELARDGSHRGIIGQRTMDHRELLQI